MTARELANWLRKRNAKLESVTLQNDATCSLWRVVLTDWRHGGRAVMASATTFEEAVKTAMTDLRSN